MCHELAHLIVANWDCFVLYWFFIAGQGGHFTNGSRKPFSSSPASSTAGRQPLKAIHSFPTPSHVGSLSSSKEIRFYNRDEPYYEFTNFYRAPIHVDGCTWPTTEHYFQAQKFVGTPYVDVIRKLPSARDAFQFSRDPRVSRWRRSDWESVKDDVMLKALHMKFMQHDKLKRKLLETGDKRLVEHTSNDSYWGDGGDGSGRNTLGKLLMQVRKDLRAKQGSVPSVATPRGSSLRRSESFSGGISSRRSHSSLSSKDDSALRSAVPTVPLSPRNRSGSLSNLTSMGSPSASEFGYNSWKKSSTSASHTTNRHTSYQPQSSILKKSQGTSPSSKYLPSWSTSSQHHPKPSTSSSSTTFHSQPSYSMTTSVSRTVHAVASPMVSRKTYKRPLPANPPSSSASSTRRHTNQSSVDYNIVTGRRKYWPLTSCLFLVKVLYIIFVKYVQFRLIINCWLSYSTRKLVKFLILCSECLKAFSSS